MDSIALSSDNVYKVIDVLRSVLGEGEVNLHHPIFRGNESKYLNDCIDSTYVSSVGPYVEKFEKDLAAFTGAKYAISIVNGTAALHLALLLAGVNRGDEVLVPTLTFIGTPNAISYCGAIPHFVDSESITFGIDPFKLRTWLNKIAHIKNGMCINHQTGKVIRAIVPVHIFGHPCAIGELTELANEFHISLVEDAAEAFGSWYKGRHAGTFGDLGVLSFNGNKIITTGGGGAILTDNQELAIRAKHLSTTAKKTHLWSFDHDSIGFNYRMPNINAALGCAQLELMPEFLSSKRLLFNAYTSAFEFISGLKILKEPSDSKSNYWLQAIVLDPQNSHLKEQILQLSNNAKIMTRPIWKLNHHQDPYKMCPRADDLTIAESLIGRVINIPSSAGYI